MRGEIVIGGQRFFRDYTCGVWRAECEWSNPGVNEYEAAMLTKIERLLDAGDALVVALDKGEWYDDVLPAIDNWQEARLG